jgi:exosortase/archaeosortase family protein
LFANLIYRSLAKRCLAVALALAIAIGANWLRVWGIILIDHLTGRQTGIVDDHLLYGWAFFAVIMAAAMALGLRWRDDDDRPPAAPDPREPETIDPAAARKTAGTGLGGFARAAGLALALAAIAPAYVKFAAAPEIAPGVAPVIAPVGTPGVAPVIAPVVAPGAVQRLLDVISLKAGRGGCAAPGANAGADPEDRSCAD